MFLASLLAACSNPPEIQVQVVDIWNHPVPSATLVVAGRTERLQVDAEGRAAVQTEPGRHELTAGAEGYIKEVAQVEVAAEQEEPVEVTLTLFPEPPDKGFWGIGEKGYVPLDALEVKGVGTGSAVVYGLQQAPEARLPGGSQPQRIVYRTDLRRDQIAQQDIRLSKLVFREKTTAVAPLGPTEVRLNLWVADGDLPYSVKEMASRNDYLLVTGSPLAPGRYAFHAGNLLNEHDEGAIERTPEELRRAYGFRVE